MINNRLFNRSISISKNGARIATQRLVKEEIKLGNKRITQGQLDAVAMRCREELDVSLRRAGTAAIATIDENVLTVRIEHSLSAAEHQLMRRASGRTFFQHYIEELVEQVYPTFSHHVEHTSYLVQLPILTSRSSVKATALSLCLDYVHS